jgi:hypothetical protein
MRRAPSFSIALGAALVLLPALLACQSSGRYAAPRDTGAAVGVAAAGALGNRSLGGCLAECIAGTRCNPRSGLCESEETASAAGGLGGAAAHRDGSAHVPAAAEPSPKRSHGRASSQAAHSEPYPPGHEHEIPASGVDGGCEPGHDGEGGPISCEMDAGAI